MKFIAEKMIVPLVDCISFKNGEKLRWLVLCNIANAACIRKDVYDEATVILEDKIS